MPAQPRPVAVPGLPAGVEVRRSARRRRTVTAYREAGRTVVLVPARMPAREIAAYVADLVGRLEARERRTRGSDSELAARAGALSRRYLGGSAVPTSVRWVTNMRTRWGSCTPLDGTIRLSHRLAAMPAYVVDYVLVHELAHLLVPGHGRDFEALMSAYPHLERARAFLDGVAHAQAHGPGTDEAGDQEVAVPEPAGATAQQEPEAATAQQDDVVGGLPTTLF